MLKELSNNKIWYGDEEGQEEEITSDDWQDLDWLLQSNQFEKQRRYLKAKSNGKNRSSWPQIQ